MTQGSSSDKEIAAKLVYVAGPYTKPDPCENTNLAVAVANEIAAFCNPLIPHLSHFWHTMTPRPYEFWTRLDFAYLERCDALLRIDGDSPGADAEVAFAEERGIPVFFSIEALREWLTRV